MKIAIAQITSHPGNILLNEENILAAIQKAKKQHADLVVFPELAIPGYTSMDIFCNNEFIIENKKSLERIAKEVKGIAAIIGFVDYEQDKNPEGSYRKYNSAAFCAQGRIVTIVDKTLLPDYDIFFENRYFTTARNKTIVEYMGKNIGIMICEDMWDETYKEKIASSHASKGAELLINISASPFYIGKSKDRIEALKRITNKYKIPFIYVNMVGSYDGYDGQVVFDGNSLVMDAKSRIIAKGKKFIQEMIITDLLHQKNNFSINHDNDREDLEKALVMGIKDYFSQAHITKAFIGLSGGIDSAVVAALAVKALGKTNVEGITMPSRFSSDGSVTDSEILANNLGIKIRTIPIENSFQRVEKDLEPSFKGLQKDVTEENIQARLRGLILMAFANKKKGMVLSTGNKTEMALGYCTLYGDMNGGLAAISDVSKKQVYELARFINRTQEIIPNSTIEKPPSAELSDEQTDEGSLGADYNIISPLVEKYLEQGLSKEQLYREFDKELVDDLISRIHLNEHKRRQSPPGIKVTKKTFGIGRRIPLSHAWR